MRRPLPLEPDTCRDCGYSLIGLDRLRCPECGLGFGANAPRVHWTDGLRWELLPAVLALIGLCLLAQNGFGWSSIGSVRFRVAVGVAALALLFTLVSLVRCGSLGRVIGLVILVMLLELMVRGALEPAMPRVYDGSSHDQPSPRLPASEP